MTLHIWVDPYKLILGLQGLHLLASGLHNSNLLRPGIRDYLIFMFNGSFDGDNQFLLVAVLRY